MATTDLGKNSGDNDRIYTHPACRMCDDKDDCDPTCLILEAVNNNIIEGNIEQVRNEMNILHRFYMKASRDFLHLKFTSIILHQIGIRQSYLFGCLLIMKNLENINKIGGK